MIHRLAWLSGAALASLMVAGCGNAPPAVQCMSMGDSNAIVAAAAVLKVDVYAAGVGCDGNVVAANAPAPLESQTFTQGQPISLSVAPGQHTVALSAYSDAAATVMIGAGCQDANFQPGQSVCIDLTVAAVDLSAPDVGIDMPACTGLDCPCVSDGDCVNPAQPRCSPSNVCVPCVSTNDNCPVDQYCASNFECALGCKDSNACAQLASADGGTAGDDLCNTTSHTCVECLQPTDCPTGKLCSPSGACVDGCDLSKGKGCTSGLTCCNDLCVNTQTDPLNCNACGTQCMSPNNACCAGICTSKSSDANNCGACGTVCSTVHAAPFCNLGQCNFACQGAFAHCLSGNTGCETSTTSTSNCGACGNVCDTMHSTGAGCNGSSCTYGGCSSGFADCTSSAPDTNGCETNLASTNQRVCSGFTMCVPATDCCSSGECMTPPVPTACYQTAGTCTSTTGGSCMYSLKPGSQVCTGGVCCNAVNGTCNANCTLSCFAGFADCDGDHSNGCETNINGDVNNCGACSRACSGTNVATKSCSAGLCNSSCNSGSGNCNEPAAPSADDGCETNTNTSTTNCGACANNCNNNVHNATGIACNGAGACTYSTCSSGFFDCNANKLDGCEDAGQGLGCCSGTTPASTGAAMTKHSTGLTNAGNTIFYYDCFPTGTPGNDASYNETMNDDAALAAAAVAPGTPAAPFNGNSTGCFNNKGNTNNVNKVNIFQFMDCSQSTNVCACWQYDFCCWSSTTSSGNCVACPTNVNIGFNTATTGNITENTKLCYNSDCTKCAASDFVWDSTTGYMNFNNTAGDQSGHPALENCYTPSPTGNIPPTFPWN